VVELAQLLAISAFVALALAIAVFLRRAGRLLAQTRDTESFRRTVKDLSIRVESSLDGVCQRIDGVRRHTIPADAIAENLSAATDAVQRYLEEARAMRAPDGAAEIRDGIVGELERAGRALQMVDHGCTILASARPGGRELEAQTAVKRGYLNLLHAREAIARHAVRAAALRAGEPAPLFQRRNV
jgi:C-terminal processing protease CtpA/Prc